MRRLTVTFFYLIAGFALASGQVDDTKVTVTDSVLVFPLQPQHVHGSSVVELPNGDLLLAWFQGSGERTADDVRIMGARKKREDRYWGAPFELADTPHLPDCNPVLFMAGDKLFLVWIAVQANKWEHSVLRVRSTTQYREEGAPAWEWQDNILLKPGEEFAKAVATKLKELPPTYHGWSEYAPRYDEMIIAASTDITKRSTGWMTRIKPLITADGQILLPLYSDGFNFSMVAISDDGGMSWLPSLPIVGRGPIQPALMQRKDGSIVAYMRDSGDAPTRVQVSESYDGGRSWTAARKTEIPNGASVDAVVLADGRWAMLGNDVDDGRYRLSLYLSTDEGKTWPVKYPIEYDASKSGRYSYPSLIQGRDGLLHMTYSFHLNNDRKAIKYVAVRP
ncbi:sialidase family protein [Parapedobacter sp. 10938]|uniref:sialidase family protein n=1 Tax=Parapedobacter flavus TaxID=3110225 RepID=UPI002DB68F38|nr:exo-alpha-sialidase [Parapedobacter sp. 10938]MEC3881971.1 exo-alpha-sialidase [Parapedobacter sp. 10938]